MSGSERVQTCDACQAELPGIRVLTANHIFCWDCWHDRAQHRGLV